jgi:hypothetical protein
MAIRRCIRDISGHLKTVDNISGHNKANYSYGSFQVQYNDHLIHWNYVRKYNDHLIQWNYSFVFLKQDVGPNTSKQYSPSVIIVIHWMVECKALAEAGIKFLYLKKFIVGHLPGNR